jgi:Spy/CpxP family protein refolding chaperone
MNMIGKRMGVAIVAGVLLAGGALWAGTAHAWGRHGFGHGWGEGMEGGFPVVAMVRKGHLTDAQEKQVAGILRAHRAALDAKATRVSEARRALTGQMTADAVDPAALAVAADQAAAAGKDLALEWAQVRQEVQALLTPEQVAELKQMRDKFLTRVDVRRTEQQQARAERLDHWIDRLSR